MLLKLLFTGRYNSQKILVHASDINWDIKSNNAFVGWLKPDPGGRGGYFEKNWVGVCGPLPKTLTLFMTKICDIPYLSYDLSINSKPYL